MAWRIDKQVVRGEVDNRIKGKVTGTIWLLGRNEPLRLELQGNPHRDLAGCVLRFSHANPKPGNLLGLASEQEGDCGDMTASRKVRIPPEPISEWLAQGAPGKDSLPWGNALYLEWCSKRNGRVVIESASYSVEISQPAWTMTAEEEDVRMRSSNFAEAIEPLGTFQAEIVQASEIGEDDMPPLPPGDGEDPEPKNQSDLKAKIEELKRKAYQISGGEMLTGPSHPDLPLEVEYQFWKNVLDFETAPRQTRRSSLAETGFQPPSPSNLTDEEITTHLWDLIRQLADQNIYLESTNHLSDRELYTLLVERVLEEETETPPQDTRWNQHIGIDEYGVPGDEDGSQTYLRYYANDSFRQQWAAEFGETPPPQSDLPYDRDRHLPQPGSMPD